MTTQIQTMLRQGITAAKQGQKAKARELLMQVVELDDHNESAWLWLSATVDEPSDQVVCLENVLTINPNNMAAQRGLDKLHNQYPHLNQPEPEPAAPPPPSSWQETPETPVTESQNLATPPPTAGESNTKLCPHCNTINPIWRNVCTICNRPFDPAETVDGLPPASLDQAAQDSTICAHCGWTNPTWRMLCEQCGKSVSGKSVSGKSEHTKSTQTTPEPANDQVSFADDYDTRPQGLLSLGAAWIAAITLNKHGAYEYEIFSASTKRTIIGLLVGTIAVPLLVVTLVLILLATSNMTDSPGTTMDTIMTVGLLTATPISLAIASIPLGIGVLTGFYLYSALIFLVARLSGGKASFTVHTQLLSVSQSAGVIVISMTSMICAGIYLAVVGLIPSETLAAITGVVGFVLMGGIMLALGLYALAMQSQAIAVAHRFSFWGGLGVVFVSALLASIIPFLMFLIQVVSDPSVIDSWTTLLGS